MAVQEATARAAYGERHAAWSTDEIRAFYVDQKDERRIAWAVVVDGAVVGHLELQIPLADNTHRAAVDILVHPESRRRGIGSALLDVAERVARAEGREVMGTEVPLGGLAITEEKWDAERVRWNFATVRAQGRRVVESVARQTATGRLVGYTTLAVASHTPHLAYQWDTLVLHEHRGRRLGLLLKAANLRALTAGLPGVRRVATWNARENEPMLRVNRALGFEVVGRLTEWQ